ncbi:tetratricopeptide repeat protein [Hyphobacterium sp. CCMP332]|nr:tetratricopeptide repeat protein [Hyphobacterium sp. CCMP332]
MQKYFWIGFSFLLFSLSAVLSFCTDQNDESKKSKQDQVSEFLNLSNEATFVGSENCISCHSEIHEDYVHTGKGRAFHLVDKDKSIEDFSNIHVYDSFSGYHYTAFWKGNDMIVREYRLAIGDTTYIRDVKAQFVIGSGNQTRSYLFEENGYFYELPITWYVKKGIWDLSPGYENGANTRFSRPISQMCMNCHNSDFEFVDFSVNKFLSLGNGIGCEKCHGPGSLHVEKRNSGIDHSDSIDYSIVNPKHLSLELQFDVCRQCHLEGVTVSKAGKDFMDFRPGMSLNDFWEVFIPVGENANDFGFASHVERLQMSECFKASGVKMNCTTCHDPHKPLAENAVSFYNEKCQKCHGMDACGADHQSLSINNNSCIACHMPKDGTTDIPHVSTSDHFIRVYMDNSEKRSEESDGLKEFRNFTSEQENKRDVFLANLEYYEKVEQNPGYLERIEVFISEVEREKKIKYYYLTKQELPAHLLSQSPNSEANPYTAFYLGEILKRQNENAIPWLERAVNLAPDNLDFARRLGNAYMDVRDISRAKIIFLGIYNKNRLELPALVNLGFIYQLEGDFPKALQFTKQALELDPLYLRARENLINIYLNLGDMDSATKYLNALILDYPEKAQYRNLKSQIESMRAN